MLAVAVRGAAKLVDFLYTEGAALNKLLKNDYRGIIVSTIHKFQGMPADLNTPRAASGARAGN